MNFERTKLGSGSDPSLKSGFELDFYKKLFRKPKKFFKNIIG